MGSILTRQATIVADAGPTAGLGHLSRSGALAVALRCQGFEVRALLHGQADPVVRDGVDWQPVREIPRGVDGVVVVDSYLLDHEAIAALRGSGPLLAFVDPTRDAPDADVLVGYGLDDHRALEGPAHACLRPMFWGVRPRDTAPTVRRVLVTVGGSAITGGATLAASVAQAVPDAEVHFVVGPYAEEAPEDGVRLVRAPSDLLDELLRADVVVSAAGQTMLEAACTGTPCVAVALAGNQRLQLAALQTAGAVVAATSDNAAATVATLAADAPRRAALAARSRTVVDGFGALRLAWRLRDLVRMPEEPQSAVPGGRRR